MQIFLCHSSNDKKYVRDLYKRLVSDGYDVWLDEVNLIPGQEWDPEIRRQVRQSGVVLVCLSNSSSNKEGYIQREIKIALDEADAKPEGTIYIIPAKIETCDVPNRLTRWQWVDLFGENGYDRLKSALSIREAQIRTRDVSEGKQLEVPISHKTDFQLSNNERKSKTIETIEGQGFFGDSITSARDFCKSMTAISASAIPIYLGMLTYLLPEKYVLGRTASIVIAIPAIGFLIASIIFVLGYFPGNTKVSLDNSQEIRQVRNEIIRHSTNFFWSGMIIFMISSMTAIYNIVVNIGIR